MEANGLSLVRLLSSSCGTMACAMLTSACVAGGADVSPSLAHERSKFAVVDPVYDAVKVVPDADRRADGAPWLYGETELESQRLQVLRKRMNAASLKVGYPGVFHEPFTRVSFRLMLDPAQSWPSMLVLRAVGNPTVTMGGRQVYRARGEDTPCQFSVPADLPTNMRELRIDLSSDGEPPALLIESGPCSTALGAWEWSPDGSNWQPAVSFPQTRSGVPPHRAEGAPGHAQARGHGG